MDMDMPMPMPMPVSNYTTHGMAMMHMNFFWGKDVIVLFQGWPNNNLGMYLLSLAFVFIISVAVELLSYHPVSVKPSAKPLITGFKQSLIYAVRMGLSYMIMLSVMSFNVGIFIAAVVGHTLGYFVIKFRALSKSSSAVVVSQMDTSKV